jgi:hypothetical protein
MAEGVDCDVLTRDTKNSRSMGRATALVGGEGQNQILRLR